MPVRRRSRGDPQMMEWTPPATYTASRAKVALRPRCPWKEEPDEFYDDRSRRGENGIRGGSLRAPGPGTGTASLLAGAVLAVSGGTAPGRRPDGGVRLGALLGAASTGARAPGGTAAAPCRA